MWTLILHFCRMICCNFIVKYCFEDPCMLMLSLCVRIYFLLWLNHDHVCPEFSCKVFPVRTSACYVLRIKFLIMYYLRFSCWSLPREDCYCYLLGIISWIFFILDLHAKPFMYELVFAISSELVLDHALFLGFHVRAFPVSACI